MNPPYTYDAKIPAPAGDSPAPHASALLKPNLPHCEQTDSEPVITTLRPPHPLADLESKGFFAPFEKEYFRKDGSRVPILIGGTRLKSDPIESVCFILDLSDLRRTQAELEAARKDWKCG